MDKPAWLRMRSALWPEAPTAEHQKEIEAILGRTDKFAVLLAENDDRQPIGFVEVSIREDIAEGCRVENIGYIEGWYVAPDWRQKGVGRALVQAAEKWSLKKGMSRIGSDTDLDNPVGQQAHQSLGFIEIDRAVLYRKTLLP